LKGESIQELTRNLIEEEVALLTDEFALKNVRPKQWDWEALDQILANQFGKKLNIPPEDYPLYNPEKLEQAIHEMVFDLYKKREEDLTAEVLRHLERVVTLQLMDNLWKDHLLQMDHLKEGIGLRGYAQKDPLLEYKKEGRALFVEMENSIATDVIKTLFRAQVATQSELQEMQERQQRARERQKMLYQQAQVQAAQGSVQGAVKTVRKDTPKVGRNDPCPCGSGKKYKKCHGA
jgi:preprotein translocase subunit SecA